MKLMRKLIPGLVGSLLWLYALAAQAATIYPNGDWFWIVGDTTPASVVWKGTAGATEANTSSDYKTWVGTLTAQNTQVSGATPFATISGSSSNGGPNLIRLTVDNTFNMVTGDALVVANNGAVSNGTWTVTVIDSNCSGGGCQVDLQGSTFSGSSESGGILGGGTKIATMAALLMSIDSFNYQNQPRGYLSASSSANYQMANTPPLFFDFTANATGLIVSLPQANLFGSVAVGRQHIIHNIGTNVFFVRKFGASSANDKPVPVGGFLSIVSEDNQSQTGNYAFGYWSQINRTLVGNSNTTLTANGSLLSIFATNATLTVGRTWTLRPASEFTQGALVLVVDEFAGVSATNTLSVAPSGVGDTINGSASAVVLNRARDFVLLETDGVSKWTTVGGAGALAATDTTVSTTSRFLGRITAGAGATEELTPANAKTILALAPTDLTPNAVATFKIVTFTSSGTYTPSAGLLYAEVECLGGGGGGGGVAGAAGDLHGGGGGGSGGNSRVRLTAAQIGASKTVTIGGGGAGGAAGFNPGAAGGDTCLTSSSCSSGQLCTGKGGSGGGGADNGHVGVGGAGGVAGTGDVAPAGNPGLAGFGCFGCTNATMGSGAGASSYLGGGAPGTATNGAGNNAGNYGSGGGGGWEGAAAANAAGGNASGGILVVREFLSQ